MGDEAGREDVRVLSHGSFTGTVSMKYQTSMSHGRHSSSAAVIASGGQGPVIFRTHFGEGPEGETNYSCVNILAIWCKGQN